MPVPEQLQQSALSPELQQLLSELYRRHTEAQWSRQRIVELEQELGRLQEELADKSAPVSSRTAGSPQDGAGDTSGEVETTGILRYREG
jgi:hypothetical protein